MQNDRRDQKELKNRAGDIVDKEISINGIGIEEKLCIDERAIWKKLQRRRLKRS